MPITAFSSFSDGLQPNQRSREHFITNTNLNDDNLWVPYADGVWFQPCCFNVTSGGFSLVLNGLPGSVVGMVIRCAVVGDTWSMTGSRSPARTFMNPQAKLTRW